MSIDLGYDIPFDQDPSMGRKEKTMSDKEKVVVKREEVEEISPLDLDLNKAIEKMIEELEGIEEHFDINNDELGVVMVTNLREIIASIMAGFHARHVLVRKLMEV